LKPRLLRLGQLFYSPNGFTSKAREKIMKIGLEYRGNFGGTGF